jgi:hypothetical protein
MLTLEYLLRGISLQISALIDGRKIRLVRHAMSNRRDGDWSGFDEMLKFDKDLLLVFTGEQQSDKFRDAELILVFVAESGTRCLLRGAFWSAGTIPRESFKKLYPRYADFEKFRAEREISQSTGEVNTYYSLSECAELAPFNNRLVIDWGRSTVSWVQSQVDKEVWQLLPKGFISPFAGWDQVFISHQELKAIVANPDGNPDWHHFLCGHDGVYVILDTKTGKLYVGSAYADADNSGGLWGRWSGYTRTGDNGNIGMVDLMDLDPNHCDHFRYSIHHVFPKGTKTKKEVIAYESRLKEKLGTRGAGGLNRN